MHDNNNNNNNNNNLPWTTTLQWLGGLWTSMNPRAMLVEANAPGKVTQARQVES